MTRRIRIENTEGPGVFTKITDVATGEELTNKMLVTRIEIDAREYVKAVLHVDGPHINLVAEAETKRTATIVFDPGDPGSVERAIMAIRDMSEGRI